MESTGQIMTVQQLVDKQMSDSTNINPKKCSNCNNYEGPYVEFSSLSNCPKFLLIKASRILDITTLKKNQVFIYPENQIHFNDGKVIYDILAIADHKGESIRTGHWIVHKRVNSSWITCNDDNIQGQRLEYNVKNKNNILFYTRGKLLKMKQQ